MSLHLKDVMYEIQEGDNSRQILKFINHQFEKNKITTISGNSGSGKTTLLYAISGILPLTEGEVLFNNNSLYKLKEMERDYFRLNHVGMIMQNLNLMSFMNVEDNILLPFYLRKLTIDHSTNELILKYLNLMNLGDIRKKRISSLSGGEQQRVAIIRAFITSPELILCDEPTGALDQKNTVNFMNSLRKIQAETHATVIVVTHDEQVYQYGDIKLYMDDGQLKEDII